METISAGSQTKGVYAQVVLSIVASFYFVYYASTTYEWHFIDNVNLLIHEAGHVIFMPFGLFLYLLGGSLFQIVFPGAFVVYFYRQKQYLSASLILFWVALNILNVSVYASDAVVMQLPLLGGDSSMHDWHAILGMLHLLPQTDQIGTGMYVTGLMVGFVAAYFSFAVSLRSKSQKEKTA